MPIPNTGMGFFVGVEGLSGVLAVSPCVTGVLDRLSYQEALFRINEGIALQLWRNMRAGVHAQGVFGASLDAQAADDTTQGVDDEDGGVFLNDTRSCVCIVRSIFSRLNINTLRGAGGGAHIAGHAAWLAVFSGDEAVFSAVAGGIGDALLRVFNGSHEAFGFALQHLSVVVAL